MGCQAVSAGGERQNLPSRRIIEGQFNPPSRTQMAAFPYRQVLTLKRLQPAFGRSFGNRSSRAKDCQAARTSLPQNLMERKMLQVRHFGRERGIPGGR